MTGDCLTHAQTRKLKLYATSVEGGSVSVEL